MISVAFVNSVLVGLVDVAGEADAIDPRNEEQEAKDSHNRNDTNNSVFLVFFRHGFDVFWLEYGLEVFDVYLENNGGNDLNDSCTNEPLVDASFIEEACNKCSNWGKDQVEHDDQDAHVWAHLRCLHDCRILFGESAISFDTTFSHDQGLLDHLLLDLLRILVHFF